VNAAKEMRKEAMSHFEKDLDVYPDLFIYMEIPIDSMLKN